LFSEVQKGDMRGHRPPHSLNDAVPAVANLVQRPGSGSAAAAGGSRLIPSFGPVLVGETRQIEAYASDPLRLLP
jgi:hypothetical protein